MKGVAIPVVFGALVAMIAPRAPFAIRGSTPACVGVRTESRYVPYGYNHVVLLTNDCARDVRCTVATDVNPSPITVMVSPATTKEVLTFMCSPQPTFVATVSCEIVVTKEPSP